MAADTSRMKPDFAVYLDGNKLTGEEAAAIIGIRVFQTRFGASAFELVVSDPDLKWQGKPTFTEWLSFTNDEDGLYSVSLSTSSKSVDFTSAILSDGITNYALHFVGALGPNEFWGLDTTFIPMGTYTLLIQGNNTGPGSLGGTVTINPASVPEPATWAMMLLGFGAIGWQLRRRRTPVLAQAV